MIALGSPRLLAFALVSTALTGCGSSMSAAMVLPSGEVLKGTATAISAGTFVVQNDRIQCMGKFDRTILGYSVPAAWSRPAVSTTCSGPRSGKSNDRIWETNEAIIHFDNGTEARLLIGDAADALRR